jgi:dihydroorotate dehydrogenase
MSINMSVNIGGLHMKIPLPPHPGLLDLVRNMLPMLDLKSLGAITVKGTIWNPSQATPPVWWRLRPECSIAIGLENPGVEALIQETMPYLRQCRFL